MSERCSLHALLADRRSCGDRPHVPVHRPLLDRHRQAEVDASRTAPPHREPRAGASSRRPERRSNAPAEVMTAHDWPLTRGVDLKTRDAQTRWLRGYPREFWRQHAPERYTLLPDEVKADDSPYEFWTLKFDLTFDGPHAHHLTARTIDGRVRQWAQALAAHSGHHLLVAVTAALTDAERRPHVHGMLSSPPGVEVHSDPISLWVRLGGGRRSIAERYNRNALPLRKRGRPVTSSGESRGGAIRYALDHGEMMIPRVACPADARGRRAMLRRKGRCIGASHPWSPSDALIAVGRAADRRSRR